MKAFLLLQENLLILTLSLGIACGFFCFNQSFAQETQETQTLLKAPIKTSKEYHKALSFYLKGEYESSLSSIRSVFEKTEDPAHLRLLAASNYIAMKNYHSAYTHLKNVIQTNHKNYQAASLWIRALRDQKRYSQAIQKGYTFIRQIGDFPALYLELAATYYQMKQYVNARNQLRKLLELDSQNYYAFYLDALIFIKQRRYEDAEFRLRNTLAIGPPDKDEAMALYTHLGFTLEQKAKRLKYSGKTDQAKLTYAQARRFYNYTSRMKKQSNPSDNKPYIAL